MIDARGVAAVVRFQGRRAFTGTRLLWWIVLSIFPGGLVLLIQLTSTGQQPSEGWLFLLYALIPCVTCVLGVFLWLTSTIQAEIDAKRWIYLAVRPAGLTSILIGNYVVTMVWTTAAAATALTLATALTDDPRVWQAWTAIAIVGTALHRRLWQPLSADRRDVRQTGDAGRGDLHGAGRDSAGDLSRTRESAHDSVSLAIPVVPVAGL